MKTQLWISLGKNSYSYLNRPKVRHRAFGVLAVALAILPALLAHPAQAAAGINQTVNFQGRLLNASGAVVPDGSYNIEFKVYQDGPGNVAGDTGGTLLWTEDWVYASGSPDNRVIVRNGYFSAQLGSICPLNGSSCAAGTGNSQTNAGVNWNSDTLWLSMNIGDTFQRATFSVANGDGEMLPMKRLSANPYAFNSQQLGGLTSSQFVQLAQGVQNDASTTASSVFINKTGTTANILDLQRGGQDVMLINNAGQTIFQPQTDSVTALQVRKYNGGSPITVFDVDTTNQRVGINTGAPAYALDVVGVVNASAGLRVGTNDTWITGVGSDGSNINLFKVNTSNEIQAGAAISVDGSILMPTDAGQVTFSDLPIDSSAAAATKESYTLRVGSTNALTVYGEADGSGGVQNVRVAVGSSIAPAYTLDVGGDLNLSSGSVYRINGVQICSSSGCTPTSANYINNQTTVQANASFFIQPSSGNVGGVIKANGSGDLLDLQDSSGNLNGSFSSTGNQLTLGRIAVSGTVAQGKLLLADGTTDGFGLTLQPATITANRTVNIPNSSAATDTICLLTLNNCGSGGVTTVGAFSASSQVNGATISGSTITFGPADGTNPGMVSTGAQSFAGSKTFTASTAITVDSSSAFAVQNSAGTLNLLAADTQNLKVNVNDGQLLVNGYGGLATPTFSAGSNQGGTLSGSSSTTYFYKYTVINAVGESASSAEGSFAATGFTPLTPPGAPTLASALGAGLGNGTYRYKVTFITANGETTGGTEATVATSLTNGQVNVTNIPTGPAGTTQRKLYRTVVNGGSGSEKFLTTIANNTTTTFTDTTADGSLGAALPGSNTARTNTNNLSVIFTAQPGASSYKIYRGTTSGSENAYQSSATTPFTDTGSAGTAGTPPTGDTIGSLGVGVAAPLGKLHVQTQAGAIAEILQGAASQASDLLQLRDSAGIVMSGFNNLGQLTLGTIASSGTVYGGVLKFADGTTDNFGATLNTTTLTANHTISLPNADGTVCLQLATACGFALSDGSTTGYIQNTTSPQTANFNITGNGTVGGTVFTPALDTASAVNLTIGQNNAASIVLAENTTISAGKSLTVTGSGAFPGSPVAGQIYYRTDTNQLYIYNGTKWQTDRSVATKIVTDGSTSQTPEKGDFMVPAAATNAESTINSALNSLPANGGVVYLAEGTYTISAAIQIPSNASLIGSGTGTIIKLKSGASAGQNMIQNKNASDTKIGLSSLVVDGNSAGNGSIGMEGVHFSTLSFGSITNITIRNVTTTFGQDNLYCSCSDTVISQTVISNGGDNGINLVSTGDNRLTNNDILVSTGDAIHITSSSNSRDIISQNTLSGSVHSIYAQGNGLTISNNAIAMFSSGGYGIYSDTTNDNLAITGNDITSFSGGSPTGIYLSGTSGTNVSGNTLRGGGVGISVNSSDTTTVSANNVQGFTTNGVFINSSTKMTVSANQASSNGSCSTANIELQTSTFSSVTGNSTYGGCHGIMIFTNSDNNSVTGNSSSWHNDYCIGILESNNNNLADNTVSGCGFEGMVLAYGSVDNVITGNTIQSVGDVGIKVNPFNSSFGYPINNTISNNRVDNAATNGIEVSGGATGNKVTGNYITYTYPGTTTLSAAIASTSSTSITVSSNPGYGNWVIGNSYVILVDSEKMQVTSGHNGATTWTVVRGFGGTTAATHLSGATVSLIYSSGGLTVDSSSTGGLTSDNYVLSSGSGAGYTGYTTSEAANSSVGQLNGSGFYILQPSGSRVGIGTASPQQMLSVNGSLNIDQGSLAGAATLTGGLTFGSFSGEGINSNRSGAGVNQNGLDLYTASSARLSITNGGLLGIGTTNPQQQVDIAPGNLVIEMPVPSGVSASANLTGGSLSAGTYHYEVTALDASSGQTTPSAEVTATATGVTASITINWSVVNGAVSYRVYRTVVGGAPGSESSYFTTSSNSFTDTGGASTSAGPPSVNTAYLTKISSGTYYASGFAGETVTCSGGQYLQNPVMVGGIVTGGTCNSVSGGSATLQTAYTGSTGGTTPEIIVDSTRTGIDIQDANSTLGAGTTLLAVRASATSTTLGTLQFGVTNNGNVTALGSVTTGSSGQFQVSNAGVMTLQTTFSPSGGGSQTASTITVTNSPTTTANTVTGLKISVTDATALANTVQGFVVDTSGITNSSANVTTALFKLKSSSAGFQIQNSSGIRILSTNLNAVELGQSNSMIGSLAFDNDTNANQITLVANSGSAGTVLVLPSATGSTGQCLGLASGTTSGRQLLGYQACQTTHTKTITLTAEYAGAVLDSASDPNCSGANSGTMTSALSKTGASPPYTVNNFYNWTTSSASTQCYDVVVRVPIPSDWSSWSGNGVNVAYYGDSTANSSGALDILGGDGSQEGTSYGTSLTVSSANTWLSTTSAALTDSKYSAGGTFTLRLRMNAKSNTNFRVGTITLNYTSSF